MIIASPLTPLTFALFFLSLTHSLSHTLLVLSNLHTQTIQILAIVSLSEPSITAYEADKKVEVCAELFYDENHKSEIDVSIPVIPSIYYAVQAGITAGIASTTISSIDHHSFIFELQI